MSREPGHLAARGRRSLDPRSRVASALRMSRREMLGERQVAAPLMAQRAAHGALRLAYRRFQPGEGAGIQLAGLRLSGKPQRPSHCQFGHETLVLAFALFAPAASRPGQHRAVRRQRGRQAAPCGHASTVRQRFLRLVPRDDQEERRRTSSPALAERTAVRTVAAHGSGGYRADLTASSVTDSDRDACPGASWRSRPWSPMGLATAGSLNAWCFQTYGRCSHQPVFTTMGFSSRAQVTVWFQPPGNIAASGRSAAFTAARG